MNFYRIEDLPPLKQMDIQELKLRKVYGDTYYYHPKLVCYWDHTCDSWLKYPKQPLKKNTTDSYYCHISNPSMDQAIDEFLDSKPIKNNKVTRESLELLLFIISIFSVNKKLDTITGTESLMFAMARSDIKKFSEYGPDFLKFLSKKHLMESRRLYYAQDKYNTFYSFINLESKLTYTDKPIVYESNNKKLIKFIDKVTNKSKREKNTMTYPIETLHSAKFSLDIDGSKLEELIDKEVKRRIEDHPEITQSQIDQGIDLRNPARDMVAQIILKAWRWNRLSYEERCREIIQDNYGGRIYTIFNTNPKWIRDYIISDTKKIPFAKVDMQACQFQLLLKEFNITSGNLYDDVCHKDYYQSFADKHNSTHKNKIDREEAKERSMRHLFSSMKDPYTKQFLNLYPEVRTKMEEYKVTEFQYNGALGKDYLNYRIHNRETEGMSKTITKLEKYGIECIKIHDELIMYIDPDKIDEFISNPSYYNNQDTLEKYYTKTICGIMSNAFELPEIQIHIQFDNQPERTASLRYMNDNDVFVIVHHKYTLYKIYKWRREVNHSDGGYFYYNEPDDWKINQKALYKVLIKHGIFFDKPVKKSTIKTIEVYPLSYNHNIL